MDGFAPRRRSKIFKVTVAAPRRQALVNNLRLPFKINVDLEFGWPLTDATVFGESDKNSPRVFFNILSRF